MITLEIVTEGGGWAGEPDLPDLVRRAASAAVAAAPMEPSSAEQGGPLAATLLLADDAAMRELNRAWRGQDKATNVLSFPSAAPSVPGEPRELGDVALAFETVAREAAQEGKSFAHHAAHLVVHGVLHLLGHDHGDDREADAMEGTEVAALASLGIADPYREDAA